MVRRIPGHDTQGEPSDPAHLSDSLPLQTPDEPEIALFTIPGSAPGGRVQDVRRANRLMLPDLDLTASAELQALAASLMEAAADAQPAVSSATDAAKTTDAEEPATPIDLTALADSKDATGDLPLHAGQADVLEVTADDPALDGTAMRPRTRTLYPLWTRIARLGARRAPKRQHEPAKGSSGPDTKGGALDWFDDETELAAAATVLAARGKSPTGCEAPGRVPPGGTEPAETRPFHSASRSATARSLCLAGRVAFLHGLLGKAPAASQVSARLLTWLQSIAVLLGRLLEAARATLRRAWSIAASLPAQLAVVRARSSRLKQSQVKALHAFSMAAVLSARIEAFDAAARLKRLRETARQALAAAARWSAALVTSVRQAASEIPLDDVIRGALFTAAVVTIVVVLARLDWSRRVELPDLVADTPDSSTSLLAVPATTRGPVLLAGDRLTPFGRLAPSLDDDARRGDLGRRAADSSETVTAALQRDTGEDTTREPATRGPGLDLPMAPATAAGLVPIDDAPPLPVTDALRTEAPPVETTEVAAGRSAPAGTPADSDAIAAALSQLELAYGRRDANLAKAVWPTVDAQALARAFDSLRSQSVEFDGCHVKVTGGTGEVQCRGTTTYVPRVGSQFARTESRQWMFRLEKGADRWVITRAAAR